MSLLSEYQSPILAKRLLKAGNQVAQRAPTRYRAPSLEKDLGPPNVAPLYDAPKDINSRPASAFGFALVRFVAEDLVELIVRKIFASLSEPVIVPQELQTFFCQLRPGARGFYNSEPATLLSRSDFSPYSPEWLSELACGLVHGTGFQDSLKYADTSRADNQFVFFIGYPDLGPDLKGHASPSCSSRARREERGVIPESPG